jgi:hypothetical protein
VVGQNRKAAIALVALAVTSTAPALDAAQRTGPGARAPTHHSGGPEGPGADPASPPVLIPGLGTPTNLKPDTDKPLARQWFEQGLLLVWAYDEAEGIRAFQMAQSLDPDCALCYWGEALARSPTFNLMPPNVDLPAAAAVATQAAAIARRKTLEPLQQRLIDAIRVRAPRTGDSFDFEGYVQAMAAMAADFPDSDAVLTLAADAQNVRWSATGVPFQGAQGWLETVVGRSATATLPAVKGRNPNYTGAIHYYIHLADAVGQPEIGLDAAARLGALAPAAPHLVHMPSHSFYGSGRFGDAVRVNEDAIASYLKFETHGPAISGYRRYLFAHDHHYAIEAALLRGDGPAALRVAREFAVRFPVQDPLFRVRPAHFAAPWYAIARHATFEQMCAMTEPMLGGTDAVRGLTKVMWHYARGETYARYPARRCPGADEGGTTAKQAAAIADLLAGPAGRALDTESEALAQMAQHVLEGRAAMLDGRPSDAEAAYRLAMNLRFDDNLQFDPPPFWYGVRRSLAAALLAQGDAASGAEAAEFYHQAIRQIDTLFATWPEDPLGLYVRSLARKKLKDPRWNDDLEAAILHWADGVAIVKVPLALI